MNKTRLTIEIDPELKRLFATKCTSEGKKLVEKVTELINQYLREE